MIPYNKRCNHGYRLPDANHVNMILEALKIYCPEFNTIKQIDHLIDKCAVLLVKLQLFLFPMYGGRCRLRLCINGNIGYGDPVGNIGGVKYQISNVLGQ